LLTKYGTDVRKKDNRAMVKWLLGKGVQSSMILLARELKM
jgi:hypothetical protein